MAKYLVLIYGDEQRWEGMSAEERHQIDDGHRTFQAKAGTAVLVAGELGPTAAAATLRAGSGGPPSVTDGPFQKTKEVLGGFYLLEAANLGEAVALVGGLTEVHQDHSGVEIRPLVSGS